MLPIIGIFQLFINLMLLSIMLYRDVPMVSAIIILSAEIKDKIEQITDEQYLQMINNLKPFSEAVRKGVFFKKALERAELRL